MPRHQRYHVMLHDPADPHKFEKMVTLRSFADAKRAEDFMSRLKRPESSRAVVYDEGPKARVKTDYLVQVLGSKINQQWVKKSKADALTSANLHHLHTLEPVAVFERKGAHIREVKRF
jgi:hypothetical protein